MLGALSAGFSLIELMIALALAAIISLTVMMISNTAREIYEGTTVKVEVSTKFRFALLTLDDDFSSWIDTSNLEFFADGRGPGTRINGQWDDGEQVPDTRHKDLGPGEVDGGEFGEYDEFATITERHYRGVEPGLDPARAENFKIHDAYQAYFRTMTYIEGKVREANVEYMLLDPNRVDEFGNPLPPIEVVGDKMTDLVLVKVVRYHDIHPRQLLQVAENFPILRRRVEVASNVTDFKVEYMVENRFNPRVGMAFRTPKEDFESPTEEQTRPDEIRDPMQPGGLFYRKAFGYGSMNIEKHFARAIAYKALQGDQQPGGISDHRPVRFGWLRNADIQFAELVQGSKIYIYSESDRGGLKQPGAAQGPRVGGGFPTGLYTVKTNISGQLEFYEDIDSSQWQGDSPNILYKASYLPQAVRITMRVLDDKGKTPKTLQRVIWIRGKAR